MKQLLLRPLVFLRLVDAHAPTELSLTNLLVYFAATLTAYSVYRSGELDITALVALVGALAAYDQKKRRGSKHTAAEADRAALIARLEAAEAKVAAVEKLPAEMESLKAKMIAVDNRVPRR